MSDSRGVKVFAPATVGNVAVGFDMLGFAVDQPGDDIVVKTGQEKGLKITKITGDKGRLPKELEKNTAGLAALTLLQHLGKEEEAIDMEIHKKMPFGSGMGSSAASAAGAVVAINEYLGRPLTKVELLPFAVNGEELASGSRHGDNVAPSLLGGMLLMRSNETLDFVRIPTPSGLCVVLIYPHVSILTKDSRGILKPEVPLKDVVQQMGNLGGFIMGLYNSDFEMIRRSLNDVIIEKQRAPLIPDFYKIKEMALSEGALGCSISGAGPTSFALCNNSLIADAIGKKAKNIYGESGHEVDVFISGINNEGVRLY
jgi:homoserine kinase